VVVLTLQRYRMVPLRLPIGMRRNSFPLSSR
jgi:hypothetical protein